MSERALALACAFVAALIASANLLRPEIVEGDALVHQYWMRSFADPALFTDGLTAALRESERYPDAYEALFRVASLAADPVAFGEGLGVALMALAGFLVFLIVREHTPWRPAAWIAGALFLALDGHRFYGGFPRAFLHVVVLLVVLLALRGRLRTAAVMAAAGALVYPPAALLAVGVLVVAAGRVHGRRPRLDPARARSAALAVTLTGAVVGVSQLSAGGASDVLSAAQARAYPDFGARGDLHFFVPSWLDFVRQNRSGFDLRATGSVLGLAAAALLLLRPANVRRLRPEVLALPVVALAGYLAAHAVLFQLYLPHRYTYPLLAFFAIAVGVTLRPAWDAATTPARAFGLLVAPLALGLVAVFAFPLGPLEPVSRLTAPLAVAAVGAAIGLAAAAVGLLRRLPPVRRPPAGALLTGLALLAVVLAAPGRRPPGQACPQSPAVQHLASLPKDAVVAGDPIDLKCLPVSARRAVVISTQLAPSYEAGYFRASRARMFAMLRAYYGRSPAAIAALHDRYDATHLWVRRRALRRERAGLARRWPARREPYGRYVRRLLAAGAPATLALPGRCRTWRRGGDEIYDVGCVARSARAMPTRQPSGSA